MIIPVFPVPFQTLQQEEEGSTALLREKVLQGRAMQEARFRNTELSFNSQMEERHIRQFCRLGQEEKKFLQSASETYHLSTRRYLKLLRIARTAADLAGSEDVTLYHLASALRYMQPQEWKQGA